MRYIKRTLWRILCVALLTTLMLGNGSITLRADEPLWKEKVFASQLAQMGNLLVNGGMEPPFYWEVPNHFVANGWNRWWIHQTVIPEYDSSRTQRPHMEGETAQVYFKWGVGYTAGIYQVVGNVTPCVPYRLSVWARNESLDSAIPHARVGIDPYGTHLTSRPSEGAVLSLPAATVWSGEQTALFTWQELTVQTEPMANALTAIVYAAPWNPNDGQVYYFDTMWDAASLTVMSFPSDRLPDPSSWTPSGFIYNVSATPLLGSMLISWNTAQPASTQLWYTIGGAATANSQAPAYASQTPLDLTPVTHHQVIVEGLNIGDTMQFVAASRHPGSSSCVTEVSAPQSASAPLASDRVPPPSSWAPSGIIQNLGTTPTLDGVRVDWDTPGFPSATQVWYDVITETVPFSPTAAMTYTFYFPTVRVDAVDRTLSEFSTDLDLALVTQHQAAIGGLQDGDTVILVALSSRVVDYHVVTEVSDAISVTITIPPGTSKPSAPAAPEE